VTNKHSKRPTGAHTPGSFGQLFVVATSRTEAEEVVQEAFARLWGGGPK
jgi:DNA-directed RNA polymerase specialized sigma24 family protein